MTNNICCHKFTTLNYDIMLDFIDRGIENKRSDKAAKEVKTNTSIEEFKFQNALPE